MDNEKSYKELFLETMIEKYSKLYNTTKDDYYLYMYKHYKKGLHYCRPLPQTGYLALIYLILDIGP